MGALRKAPRPTEQLAANRAAPDDQHDTAKDSHAAKEQPRLKGMRKPVRPQQRHAVNRPANQKCVSEAKPKAVFRSDCGARRDRMTQVDAG